MLIRYGFDIEAQLWQPTSLVTMMDVHASQHHDITWENGFELAGGALVETFIDTLSPAPPADREQT
jgi:hypothetical protein